MAIDLFAKTFDSADLPVVMPGYVSLVTSLNLAGITPRHQARYQNGHPAILYVFEFTHSSTISHSQMPNK